jgi:hypothetical protein
MTDPIRHLIDASETYLRRFGSDGARDVVSGIARWKDGPTQKVTPQPHPACGYLDEAIAAIDSADELRNAIEAARPALKWITYDLYPREDIGPRFPEAHAFASLIGGDAPVLADDFELGLFLIAPKTLYRDHHHAAPEIYAPLTGPHGWRFGTDHPFRDKPAHEPVWNPAWGIHATLVRDVPFLCLFGWTRDVNTPAKTVTAIDWDMIEARL